MHDVMRIGKARDAKQARPSQPKLLVNAVWLRDVIGTTVFRTSLAPVVTLLALMRPLLSRLPPARAAAKPCLRLAALTRAATRQSQTR